MTINDRNIDEESLLALLALEDASQRIALLETTELLNADGLSQLLDHAMQLARTDPGKASRLAHICSAAAEAANAPEIIPRATYACAQTHAINGEFDIALALIQASRSEYEKFGDPLSGIRTNLGKIHVLNELGRHQEALEAGDETLLVVEALPDPGPQAGMILAVAHMNRGVCFETLGRYEDALAAYTRAETAFTEMEMYDRLGDVHNNRGIVLSHLGKVGEALAAFEAALAIWQEEELLLLQAQTLSNIGEAYLALGNYTRGLNAFEQARDLFETLDAQADHSILLRKTADAYLALNLYPEAVSTYRNAVEMLEKAGMSDHRARALWGLGASLIALGENIEAENSLNKAAELFETAGNIPMLSSVKLEQAALVSASGDVSAGAEYAGAALALVDKNRWPVEYFYANLRFFDLYLPDAAAAEPFLSAAGEMYEILPLPVVRYRLNSRRGHLFRLQGRHEEARDSLNQAMTDIEGLRGNLAHEATRTSFLQDKSAVYNDLMLVQLESAGEDATWSAFETAERAKSRTLVDMMSGVVSQKTSDKGRTGLSGRIQALQAELGATYNRFYDTENFSLPLIKELQKQARKLEEAIARLRLQAAGQQSENPFDAGRPQEIIRSDLITGRPLLSYYIIGEEILAFYIADGSIQLFRGLGLLSKVTDLMQRLGSQWERFKAGPEFVQRNLPLLERSANRVLQDLYEACFAPVANHILGQRSGAVESLTIIPHGALHQVPFQALFDGEMYLLDRFEIAYAPSAAVHVLGERKPKQTPKRGLIAGLSDVLIPMALVEAQSVAEHLLHSGLEIDLLLDDQASVDRVMAFSEAADIIHLACHGLFRSDNPLFSSVKLSDSWLTAADVMSLELPESVVVLSACESGRSGVIQGEEVIGLPRAFMAAGASAVLVSLWLAQDDAASVLMTNWYREMISGADRASALRFAQQALRKTYSHPYYWAPFILVGQR